MPNLSKAQQAERIAELEAQISASTTVASSEKTEIQRILDSGSNARLNITVAGVEFVIHKGFLMFNKNPDGLALIEGFEQALYNGKLLDGHDLSANATVTLAVGKEKEADKVVEVDGVEIHMGGSSKPTRGTAGGFTRSTVQMPT